MQPLFKGTVHFVSMSFTVKSENRVFSVSNQDMNTIVDYATKAAVPISLYADQYGESALRVNPQLTFTGVELDSRECSQAQMELWVKELSAGLPKPACIAIMFPPEIDNSSVSRKSGAGGFHSSVDGVTYLNVYVSDDGSGNPLTVQDVSYRYAGRLSHEMAEMTVNPKGGNPEVCDPCGPNYNSTYIDYFDQQGNYLTTTQTPPYDVNFAYDFYINGIVQPAFAKPEQAPAAACSYAPVKLSEAELLPIAGGIRCDGFYSADDQFRHAFVGENAGTIFDIYFSPNAGKGVSAVGQIPGLLDVAGFYTPDDKRRHVLTVSGGGEITEIFFHPGQGQSMIAQIDGAQRISGFYSEDDHFRHAIVAAQDGSVWEIFFHPDKGSGREKLGIFRNVVDVGSFYSSDDQFRHAIVATADGNISEIYYQPNQGLAQTVVGNVPGIAAVTAFYVPGALFSRRLQALDNTGMLYELRYSPEYGQTRVKLNQRAGLLDVGGFFTPDDKARHAILLDGAGDVREDYYYV